MSVSNDPSPPKPNDEEDYVAGLSPDMFEDDMDVDFTESSSKKFKSDSSPPSWRGASMYDIYKSLSPWSAPEFPLVTPSSVHAVLYHISKTAGTAVSGVPPTPQRGKDIWDKDHVRLPCSNESLYAEQTNPEGQPVLKKRWDVIKEALSQNITSSHELQEAILKYNSRYKTAWKFNGLHKLFNTYLEEEEAQCFFSTTLPAMIKLALRLPDLVQAPIPLLRQHHNRSISLSQEQISCLLANAFFCTFPRRNAIKGKSEYRNYPDINFNRLFQCTSNSVMEKLKCIFNYFRRVCKNVPCGVMTFTRRTVISNSCPKWNESDLFVGSVPLHITSEGTIEEDGVGLLQVDFANKFLGGGVLGHGCVQEEIRFVICPELLISMLFTESMRPTESLLMIGCEQFSGYTGYADSFQWSTSHEDATPFDASGRRRCAVVAIDALYFSDSSNQYLAQYITRELNKAWVGFSHYSDSASSTSDLTLPAVATGNWGCGAFRGSPRLKALIQLMACCVARRPMVYYTFGDTRIRDDVIDMYNFLSRENTTIKKLFKCLCQFQNSSTPPDQLYNFIKNKTKVSICQQLQNVFKPSNVDIKPVSQICREEKEKPMIIQNVGESSKAEPENVEQLVEIIDDSDSQSTLDDVEKGLHSSKGQESSSISNACLFDEMSHLDAVKSPSSKKHGTLSYFESDHKSSVSEVIAKSNNSSSESQVQKDKKKISGKISDYFQPIPNKFRKD